jgi:hypothetical protein
MVYPKPGNLHLNRASLLSMKLAVTAAGAPTTTSGGRQSEKLVFRGAYNDAPLKFDTPQLHQK